MSFSIFVSVFQGSTWCHRSGRTWSASINRERMASSIPRRAGNRGYVRARSAPTTWSRSSAKSAVVASPWRGTRTAMWITNADTSRGFSAPTADSAASKRRRFTPTSERNIQKKRSLSSIWSSEHDKKIASSLVLHLISSDSRITSFHEARFLDRDLRTSLKTNRQMFLNLACYCHTFLFLKNIFLRISEYDFVHKYFIFQLRFIDLF